MSLRQKKNVADAEATGARDVFAGGRDRKSILSNETSAQAITAARSSDTTEHHSEEGKSGENPNIVNLQ